MTIVEFLLARIAEDETAANAFTGTAYARWHFDPDPDPGRIGGAVIGANAHCVIANDWSSPHNPAGYIGVSGHIVRWEPGRVLAECAAKRKIIDIAFEHARLIDSEWGCCHSVEQIRAGRCERSDMQQDELLLALAEPYADHPDYREEWRP